MGCCWTWAGGAVSGGRVPTCLGPNWWEGGRHPGPGRGFAGFALQSRGPSPHGQARKMPGAIAVPPDNMAGTVDRTPAGPLCVAQRPGSVAPRAVGQAGPAICTCGLPRHPPWERQGLAHLHLWVATPPPQAWLSLPEVAPLQAPGDPASMCSPLCTTGLRATLGAATVGHVADAWPSARPTPQLSTLRALVSPLWGWALTRVHHVSPGPARRHGGSGGSWPGAQRAGAALGGGAARE